MNADDAFEDAERLLRRIAGLLLAVGGDDGVPPDVGGRLSARGLLRADQSGGHVGNPIHLPVVERVVLWVIRIPQDVVMLRRPFRLGAGTVVVCPNDLVDERIPSEYPVQQHLAVVDFSIVHVEEE